jgi:hypothetical protein
MQLYKILLNSYANCVNVTYRIIERFESVEQYFLHINACIEKSNYVIDRVIESTPASNN